MNLSELLVTKSKSCVFQVENKIFNSLTWSYAAESEYIFSEHGHISSNEFITVENPEELRFKVLKFTDKELTFDVVCSVIVTKPFDTFIMKINGFDYTISCRPMNDLHHLVKFELL